MSGRTQKILSFFATIAIALVGGFGMRPLLRHGVSPGTAGIVAGVLGTLCIVGIIGGIWGARRSEARRKAKEQIWLKH